MTKNSIKMSLATVIVLSTGAYAGLIKTDADLNNIVVEDNKQFGFGGWNFDNVNVVMINVETGNPTGETFNVSDGSYTGLGEGESFDSDLISTEDNVTVMGQLHGKDYPVGEPAGIKIINGDTVQHAKAPNCIMTSSYLSEENTDSGESGYLDTTAAAGPQPVICSSPYQTHKRFKINMLPVTVAHIDDTVGGYGKSIDLVFNLEAGDTSEQRYQILQKINNYTDKRLAGYKMEVLDENGIAKPTLLSFELLDGADNWTITDLANMSHGLWGPADDNFETDGFFDDERAHYPVALNADKNVISYEGPMQGSDKAGNYQSLFGNWLPSIWEPTGIFFDDDGNSETDAVLMAFYGDPDKDGVNGWHKGFLDNWAVPTDQEFLQWGTDPAYFTGAIEDVLNLGLNYVIKVGDNTQIGSTFTLRLTPYIAPNDQTAPSYVDENATIPNPTPPVPDITDGTVAISPAPTFLIGATLILSVKDGDQNTDAAVADTVEVEVTTDTGDKETVTLTETDVDSEVFTATIPTELTSSAPATEDGKVNVIKDAQVTVTYQDNDGPITATTIATVLDADDSSQDASSGGGGCTYNPNSKNFDMTFLMMIALGSLYAFRRRFIK